MASKLFFVLLALAVVTAVVLAEEDYAVENDFFQLAKRGRKGGRRKNAGFKAENLYPCSDGYGRDNCVCDKSRNDETVLCG